MTKRAKPAAETETDDPAFTEALRLGATVANANAFSAMIDIHGNVDDLTTAFQEYRAMEHE